ncbi:lipopolysaccharide biosynthesis protein [Halosimplex litoreum]|uniref:Lipopolysaccharide biosynthesis protein n=1 Tax=Halosimplex litoreum TaxID=1198301 RepID=A0A7T3FXS6_9EURY|nr:lipopolysaccharide biosynthesis protein [Halosimplex litoreum]QPV62688.1 lipopolysaccharide biosynthesis protein [Halosimplex litoreum]
MAPKLGKEAALHFASQAVVSLSGFFATYAIASVLGSAPLGRYSKAVAVLFMVIIPAAAIGAAVTKRMSEGRAPEQYFGAGVVLMGGAIAGLVAVTLLVGPHLDRYVGAPVAVEFALLLAAAGTFRLVKGVLKGEKQVARSGSVQGFERIFRTVTQVALLLLGFVVTGLVLGHALSLFVGSLVGLFVARSWPRMPDAHHVRHLGEFVRYSWMGKLKGRTFGWTDTIVLGFFVSSSLIGIYEVAWTLASTLILVSNSIEQTLFPEFSELSVEDDYEQIHHYLNEGLVFAAVFSIPGLAGAAMVGPRVLAVYSTEFRQGAQILLLLILARLFAAFGEQFISAINAIDRPDVAFRISGLFIGVNVVLNVILVWQFGWMGAAVATLLAGVGLLVLGYASLARLIGRPAVPWRAFGAQSLATLVMVGYLAAVLKYAPGGPVATLALVVSASVVYTAALFVVSERIRTKAASLVGRSPG